MQWKLYNGNWWLFLKGPGAYEALRYYPMKIYESGQLSKNAEFIEYGGEVTRFDPKHNWSQMGSSAFPSTGYGHAEFQNTIFYIPCNENDGIGVWANLSKIVEGRTSCWDFDITQADKGDPPKTIMC